MSIFITDQLRQKAGAIKAEGLKGCQCGIGESFKAVIKIIAYNFKIFIPDQLRPKAGALKAEDRNVANVAEGGIGEFFFRL